MKSWLSRSVVYTALALPAKDHSILEPLVLTGRSRDGHFRG